MLEPQSGEQLGTGRRELHIGPEIVPPQPAQRDRSRRRGSVLIRRAALFEKWAKKNQRSSPSRMSPKVSKQKLQPNKEVRAA
jgi:hypothetical protein